MEAGNSEPPPLATCYLDGVGKSRSNNWFLFAVTPEFRGYTRVSMVITSTLLMNSSDGYRSSGTRSLERARGRFTVLPWTGVDALDLAEVLLSFRELRTEQLRCRGFRDTSE